MLILHYISTINTIKVNSIVWVSPFLTSVIYDKRYLHCFHVICKFISLTSCTRWPVSKSGRHRKKHRRADERSRWTIVVGSCSLEDCFWFHHPLICFFSGFLGLYNTCGNISSYQTRSHTFGITNLYQIIINSGFSTHRRFRCYTSLSLIKLTVTLQVLRNGMVRH